MNNNEVNSEEHVSLVSTYEIEEKRFQLNPSPQKHYQMTITIKNAPGPLDKLKALAYYRALNCSYILAGTPEVYSKPDKNIFLQFKKIAPNQYQGDFYVDAMKDEDYYGQGICKWEFGGVNALFSATDSDKDTLFSASITPEDLQSKKIELNHLKEKYPTIEDFTGALSQGKLKKERFKPEEYFTFDIELEELK
ncbi:hypothetical protein [Neisseria sp. Ec49-e6-T10]|uniref:hypothetical protein n=1 Tax=Neisseria sp. Ec49-e6-T10 TaxID=3140744 RepID=UPI003EBE0FB4